MRISLNNFRSRVFLPIVTVSAVILSMVSLTGCDLGRNHLKPDRSAHLEIQDYRDALAPRITEDSGSLNNDIPDFQSYVAPPDENLKPMPLVSVSVNQTIPLRDVLFELAGQANYNLQLDPRITGAVIFTAREKPFDSVIEQISDMAGLRYKFDEDYLRIELDTPYRKIYKINYLNYTRNSSASVRNEISVVSGDGADTGSGFEASGESSSDFWAELETNLTGLLEENSAKALLVTKSDPQITAVDQGSAPVKPVLAVDEKGNAEIEVKAPQAILQVQSLPVSASEGAAEITATSSFTMNKQSGLVMVVATEKQHREVAEYLDVLRASVMSQVLIEAKVFEVTLSDEFSAGINWDMLRPIAKRYTADLALTTPALLWDDTSVSDVFSIGYAGDRLDVLIEGISRFGALHAVANPRMTVLNNQAAVLNVATNIVYFNLEVDSSTSEGIRETTVTSELKNVPEGVLINVQPSVDLERNIISLAVRPTVTRIVNRVEDPGVAFAAADAGLGGQITSLVPELNVQEIDSVVKMRSGEAIVMGGLMQDRNDAEQVGVPVLSEIPVFGGLFRKHRDKVTKTELVIFLRATIIDGSNVDETDKYLYKKFSGDRHPLDL
jgi:general secretion pathway protein D